MNGKYRYIYNYTTTHDELESYIDRIEKKR